MTPLIGDTASDVEPETAEFVFETRTQNGSGLADLFQVIARSTACSSMVFFGLLAWASLSAHIPSKAEIATVPLQLTDPN
jgi:hypothetical protein